MITCEESAITTATLLSRMLKTGVALLATGLASISLAAGPTTLPDELAEAEAFALGY